MHSPIRGDGGPVRRLSRAVPMCEDHTRILAMVQEGWNISDADIARISPLLFKHINFLGRYAFDLPPAIRDGALRPLRNPSSE